MKATATISLNENCSMDRARALTKMIRNQLGRLLHTKDIKGVGNIEKTANSMTHIHLLLDMKDELYPAVELIFNDVCEYYSKHYKGWIQPTVSETGYLFYINKQSRTDNHCDW